MSLSRDKKSALFLLVILMIIVGIIVTVSISLKSDPMEESLKSDPVIKVLWLIKDDDDNVLSTDILVFYPESKQAVCIDILGNTGAIFRSINRVDRIDAVYKDLGIGAYRTEIERLVGKKIPFTVELTLSDLELFADYLGGINAFVPVPVDAVSETGERWLLPSGAVALDGDKIRTFMTLRLEGETDADVEDRRQSVFLSLLSALRENRNNVYSKKNFPVFKSHFKVNLDDEYKYRLLEQIAGIDTERIVLQTISGSLRTVESGKTLLFPLYDGQFIKDVMDQSISSLVTGDYGNSNRSYVLAIQNGTTVQGLARNTSFLLQSSGYEVLETSNADVLFDDTTIVNNCGNAEAAAALGKFIRCNNIVDSSDAGDIRTGARVDFTLILGKDFDGRFVRRKASEGSL